jgi:hypothetical protein
VKIARVFAAIATATGLGAAAHSAGARAPRLVQDVSTNWGGYAVTYPAGTGSFTSVTATWTQPTVSCATGDAGARAAVWVGLGGYRRGTHGLEQAGVSSDCNGRTNLPEYYAWYELTPRSGVVVKQLEIRGGDTMRVTVSVNRARTRAVFQLDNRTRALRYTRAVAVSTPNLSSAEWIVEAPSGCNGVRCGWVRLANFGSVALRKVATTGNGHRGTILDRRWQATAIRMAPSRRQTYSTGSTAGAAPRALAADGSAFRIAWRPNAASDEPGRAEPSTKPVNPLLAGPFR